MTPAAGLRCLLLSVFHETLAAGGLKFIRRDVAASLRTAVGRPDVMLLAPARAVPALKTTARDVRIASLIFSSLVGLLEPRILRPICVVGKTVSCRDVNDSKPLKRG